MTNAKRTPFIESVLERVKHPNQPLTRTASGHRRPTTATHVTHPVVNVGIPQGHPRRPQTTFPQARIHSVRRSDDGAQGDRREPYCRTTRNSQDEFHDRLKFRERVSGVPRL